MQPAPPPRGCGSTAPRPTRRQPAGRRGCPAWQAPARPGWWPGRSTPQGSAACCRQATPAATRRGRVGASGPASPTAGPAADGEGGAPAPASPCRPQHSSPTPPTGGVQHRPSDQDRVVPIQAADRRTQRHRRVLGNAGGDPQHPRLATRAHQPARAQCRHRSRPVHPRHHSPIGPAGLHEAIDEVATHQPPAVADQQLNGSLGGIQPRRCRPQGRRQVLDTGSKS